CLQFQVVGADFVRTPIAKTCVEPPLTVVQFDPACNITAVRRGPRVRRDRCRQREGSTVAPTRAVSSAATPRTMPISRAATYPPFEPAPTGCPCRADRKITASSVERKGSSGRSEEHTSELQSRFDLVC